MSSINRTNKQILLKWHCLQTVEMCASSSVSSLMGDCLQVCEDQPGPETLLLPSKVPKSPSIYISTFSGNECIRITAWYGNECLFIIFFCPNSSGNVKYHIYFDFSKSILQQKQNHNSIRCLHIPMCVTVNHRAHGSTFANNTAHLLIKML